MTIKFESFFKFKHPEKIKVKFNRSDGFGGNKALDNLQNELETNDWYDMNAHRSEKGHANNNLDKFDYVLSFAQYYLYGSTFYIFGGLYKKIGIKNSKSYELELQDNYREYRKRLIIKLEKSIGRDLYLVKFKTVCDKMNAIIYEVMPERELLKFPGYNNVRLMHKELSRIIDSNNIEWKTALASVKGVYCITDIFTGQIYIGAVYGKEGIWHRWKEYVDKNNLTGGNKFFEELKEKNPLYIIDNFQYSILEVIDPKTNYYDIFNREKYWKEVFKSKEFGMNKN